MPSKPHIWSQTAVFEPGYVGSQEPQEAPVRPSMGLLEAPKAVTLPWEEDDNPADCQGSVKTYYLDGTLVDEESIHYPDIATMLDHMRSI